MADAWNIKLFQRQKDDDPKEICPTEEFLDSCPDPVAADLIAIIEAVAAGPPPQFRGGGMWEAMHGSMKGFYEARTRGPDRRLYRLFCLLERETTGLKRPAVVIICGLSKPHGSVFSASDYAGVRELGTEYRRHSPRNLV
jgi:hypothetical protein